MTTPRKRFKGASEREIGRSRRKDWGTDVGMVAGARQGVGRQGNGGGQFLPNPSDPPTFEFRGG